MKTDTVQLIPAIAMMGGVILCWIWIALYFTRIDAALRRRFGESLGVRIVWSWSKPSNWVAEGGNVGFGTSLLIFLSWVASLLFLLLLPITIFCITGFFVADTLSKIKP